MQTLTIRELRNRPGAAQEELQRAGEILLTNNGKPVALMLSLENADLGDTLEAMRRVRGQMALQALRRQARESGAARWSDAAIDELIRDTRAERR